MQHGIDADVIVGAKTKDMLILEEQMEAVAGNLLCHIQMTDPTAHAGMVTNDGRRTCYNNGKKYDVCVAIGPMIMMKFVCLLTQEA